MTARCWLRFSTLSLHGRMSSCASDEQIPEHDRVVMRLIMRSIDEGEISLPRELAQPPEFPGMSLDFRPVAPPEFRPALGIVSKPFAQFGAGRDLSHPFIDRGMFLLHSARPQPVD